MDLNYFEILHITNANTLWCLSRHGSIFKYILLATKISGMNDYCYNAFSNNWLTLDKCGNFRVIDDFNYNN